MIAGTIRVMFFGDHAARAGVATIAVRTLAAVNEIRALARKTRNKHREARRWA
jgi:hypothetical protein